MGRQLLEQIIAYYSLIRKSRWTNVLSTPALSHYFQLKCNKPGFPGKFVRDPANLKYKGHLESNATDLISCSIHLTNI